MTKPDDNRATQGCAPLLGWALVTTEASVAVGLAAWYGMSEHMVLQRLRRMGVSGRGNRQVARDR